MIIPAIQYIARELIKKADFGTVPEASPRAGSSSTLAEDILNIPPKLKPNIAATLLSRFPILPDENVSGNSPSSVFAKNPQETPRLKQRIISCFEPAKTYPQCIEPRLSELSVSRLIPPFLMSSDGTVQRDFPLFEHEVPPGFSWGLIPAEKYIPGDIKNNVTNFIKFWKRRTDVDDILHDIFPLFKEYSPDLLRFVHLMPDLGIATPLQRDEKGEIVPKYMGMITIGEYLETIYGKKLANEIIENYINHRVNQPGANKYEITDPEKLRFEILERFVPIFVTEKCPYNYGYKVRAYCGHTPEYMMSIAKDLGIPLSSRSVVFVRPKTRSDTILPHEFEHVVQFNFAPRYMDFWNRDTGENHPVQVGYRHELDAYHRSTIEFEALLAELKYLWQQFTRKPIKTEEDVEEMFETMEKVVPEVFKLDPFSDEIKERSGLEEILWELYQKLLFPYQYLNKENKKRVRRRVLEVLSKNKPRHPLETETRPIPA